MRRRDFLGALGGAVAAGAASSIAKAQMRPGGPPFGRPPGMGPGPRPGPGPAAPAVTGAPFIDVHTHLDGRLPMAAMDDYDGAADAAIKMMDSYGVRLSIVMPTPQPPGFPRSYDFEDLRPAVGRRSDRLAFAGGGGSLNPMIHAAAHNGTVSAETGRQFEARARQIVAAGAAAFGEMACEHLSFFAQHPYESVPPDHPLFLLLADIAADAGIPIDLHMEAVRTSMPTPSRFAQPPNPPTLAANIDGLSRLLAHNRRAKLSWAHEGWDNTDQRTVELSRQLLRDNPNLFMSLKSDDLSSMTNKPLDAGRHVRHEWLALIGEFPDRFVIGSDQFYASPRFPMQRPVFLSEPRLLFNQLPAELRAKVGLDNAKAIYRLHA